MDVTDRKNTTDPRVVLGGRFRRAEGCLQQPSLHRVQDRSRQPVLEAPCIRTGAFLSAGSLSIVEHSAFTVC